MTMPKNMDTSCPPYIRATRTWLQVSRRQYCSPLLGNLASHSLRSLAGGLSTKTAANVKEGKGRFNDTFFAGIYKEKYVKSTYVNALAKWEAVAEAEGVTRAGLAYRWVAFDPLLKKESGDGIIIGSRSNDQLENRSSASRRVS